MSDDFITIREAVKLTDKSDITIRRLIKLLVGNAKLVKQELTNKGFVYRINKHALELLNKNLYLPDILQPIIKPEIKETVLNRDNKTCQICKRELQDNEIEFDHYLPLFFGGLNTEDNLFVICKTCNVRKNNQIINKDKAKEIISNTLDIISNVISNDTNNRITPKVKEILDFKIKQLNQTLQDLDDYLGIKESAEFVSKSEHTIRKLTQNNKLPHIKVKGVRGYEIKISRADLRAYYNIISNVISNDEDIISYKKGITNNVISNKKQAETIKKQQIEPPNIIREIIKTLKNQLYIKDKQIDSLSNKIDQLIERDRETNIILKSLQDRVFMLEGAKMSQNRAKNEPEMKKMYQNSQKTEKEPTEANISEKTGI